MLPDLAGRLTCSVPEAGQVLGIGRDAAYAAAKRGQIPTLRLGRSLRVSVPLLMQRLGTTPDMSAGTALAVPNTITEPSGGAYPHDDTKQPGTVPAQTHQGLARARGLGVRRAREQDQPRQVG